MTKLEQLHFDNHDYRDAAQVTQDVTLCFYHWCYDNVCIYKVGDKAIYSYNFKIVTFDELFNIFLNEKY